MANFKIYGRKLVSRIEPYRPADFQDMDEVEVGAEKAG